MKASQLLFAITLVIAVTMLSGLVSGSFAQRWGEPEDLAAAGRRLADFPEQFGDWHLASVETLPLDVLETLECSGYVRRVYRNVKTDETVSLCIVVGPSGPISVHRPEICYSSREFDIIEAPSQFKLSEVDPPRDSFRKLALRSNDLSGHLLHVAYAWSAGDGWVAPEHPRFSFAGHRVLYKLQLASPVVTQPFLGNASPCETFLRDSLPLLDASLFPVAR
jgi:hypothetical protein